jgi:hypothetical protein
MCDIFSPETVVMRHKIELWVVWMTTCGRDFAIIGDRMSLSACRAKCLDQPQPPECSGRLWPTPGVPVNLMPTLWTTQLHRAMHRRHEVISAGSSHSFVINIFPIP